MTGKKISIVLAIILAVLMAFWFLGKPLHQRACNQNTGVDCSLSFQSFIAAFKCGVFWCGGEKSEAPTLKISSEKNAEAIIPKAIKTDYNIPLFGSERRITKKPFGILINPKTSPILNEKFSGYHTGTDLEIFPEEINADVEVRAICDGKIVQKKKVSGYGGVIIQSCILNEKKVTVLYGHLRLSDAPAEIEKTFFRGDKLAILGADNSADTDGERKHLHLGIKIGEKIDVRGYVPNRNELIGWIDPEKILFPPVL